MGTDWRMDSRHQRWRRDFGCDDGTDDDFSSIQVASPVCSLVCCPAHPAARRGRTGCPSVAGRSSVASVCSCCDCRCHRAPHTQCRWELRRSCDTKRHQTDESEVLRTSAAGRQERNGMDHDEGGETERGQGGRKSLSSGGGAQDSGLLALK